MNFPDGLLWLLVYLGPLFILQRQLHREIQSVFLILTRRVEVALALFSILFFPGVLLHETSHFVAAVLLRVPTGGFSLIPRLVDSTQGAGGDKPRLQLGYVETAKTDILRDSMIGAAPLLAGGLFVTYAGIYALGLDQVWIALEAGTGVMDTIHRLIEQSDFWLWFYLIFVISSTMLPSASDRRAWLPLAAAFAVLLGISLLAGAGPWLAVHFAQPLNQAFRAMAVVLGISAAVHLILWAPVMVFRHLLSRLTGLQVTG